MTVVELFQGIWINLRNKVTSIWRNDLKPQSNSDKEEAMIMPSIEAWRTKTVFVIFFLAGTAVLIKAGWLQLGFDTDFLKQQGEARYARTISVPAQRGRILDRNGVVLASTIPARSIWADPSDAIHLTRPEIEKLAQVLDMPADTIAEKIEARKDKTFVYLKRQVDVDVGEAVRALQLSGVHSSPDVLRNYPDGSISAHVVGFTDSDNNGREGVELAMDDALQGAKGSRRVIRDRLGRIVEDIWIQESQPGKDVILSLDSRLQYMATQALTKAVEKHQAKAGAVVVADVRTGEVLALANVPTYDPNERRSMRFENMRNRVITDLFEPGSTMKPFAVAKALDEGLVRPDTQVETGNGKLTILDRTIGDIHAYGLITVSQVISKSSNVGTAKIALEMEPKTLWEMYHELGFGTAPNLGFPGAASGRLRPYKSWRPIEQATISYGHGISVSLMQLVRAYTALARNGDVIDLTLYRQDTPAKGTQVFRPEVARQMRSMMADTVRRGGTAARRVNVEGYTVAGKTGTANKIENGQYVDKYVASFVGVSPAAQPRLVVAVMIDEPTKGSHYGAGAAGPVFNEVTANALRLLGIHPDALEQDSTPKAQIQGLQAQVFANPVVN